jgi:hypothetical protein
MRGGRFSLDAPHICGELIHVEIKWSYSPGFFMEPPDGDEDWDYEERCPKCGISLVDDDLFEATINRIAEPLYEESEADEPDDFDPTEAQLESMNHYTRDSDFTMPDKDYPERYKP